MGHSQALIEKAAREPGYQQNGDYRVYEIQRDGYIVRTFEDRDHFTAWQRVYRKPRITVTASALRGRLIDRIDHKYEYDEKVQQELDRMADEAYEREQSKARPN